MFIVQCINIFKQCIGKLLKGQRLYLMERNRVEFFAGKNAKGAQSCQFLKRNRVTALGTCLEIAVLYKRGSIMHKAYFFILCTCIN